MFPDASGRVWVPGEGGQVRDILQHQPADHAGGAHGQQCGGPLLQQDEGPGVCQDHEGRPPDERESAPVPAHAEAVPRDGEQDTQVHGGWNILSGRQ